MASFCIIGAGKVGSALARLLAAAGWEFVGAAGRSARSARRACEFAGAGRPARKPSALARRADLIFLTTPDDAIARVCREIAEARGFRPGALPASILAPARECGARVGSLHPLQTFAAAEQAVRLLPGAFCCVEGDAEAVVTLRAVAGALRMRVLTIPTENKALYHAASVTACNFLVALEDAALRMAEAAGIPRGQALEAMIPLIRGTVSNMESVGIPDCLTGPIERGDVESVRLHLKALKEHAPELVPLYRMLGAATVRLSLMKGTIGEETAARMQRLLGG